MPRALAIPVRQVVLRRCQAGQTVAEIAAALALPVRTVRHFLRRTRLLGAAALVPAYAHCGSPGRSRRSPLYEAALDLRRHHPAWGAGLIRVLLHEQRPRQPLPTERTLQRWFRAAGLAPAPTGRRPVSRRQRAQHPHDIWQMDATELVKLQTGQQISWLRLIDEYSGAVLYTKVFPVGRWEQVGDRPVQTELRHAFRRWGRPKRLRIDNGAPWGNSSGLPTDLALWLWGLAIDLLWNHPRRPKENAVVERSQGVSKGWIEPHTCASVQECQDRLDRMDRIQREKYPSVDGRSRRQAYPQLAHSGRAYGLSWEARHWNLQRVLDGLAEYAVRRRVDQRGQVSLYERAHYVGIAYRGQEVYATVDAVTREWVFQDEHGQEVKRQPASELTRARIVNLQVAQARPRHPDSSHGKTP
jgi:hypothetical protein